MSPNQFVIALQVLDLGFNLLRVMPSTAFYGVSDLTLLALDGNPMATLPEDAFRHLGRTVAFGHCFHEHPTLLLNKEKAKISP